MLGIWALIAKTLGPTVTKTIGTVAFQCTKHAPELLMGGRMILTVGGTIAACKATVSAKGLLEQYEQEEKEIKNAAAIIREKQALYQKVAATNPGELEQKKKLRDEHGHPVIIDPSEYTDRDYKMELLKLKTKLIGNMAKKYAISIGLFGLSLVCDILGYRSWMNRTTALAAAYASLSNMFQAYQKRVQQVVGIEQEEAIRKGTYAIPVEGTVTDEKGNVITQPGEPVVEMEELTGPFEIMFGEGCENWTKSRTYNKNFLMGVQNDLNRLLGTRMFVTLNDLGTALDSRFVPRKSWYGFGWSNSEKDMNEIRAGLRDRIDLGIDNPINDNAVEFVLQPNIDGFILADIPEDEGLHAADQLRGICSNLNGEFDLHKMLRR